MTWGQLRFQLQTSAPGVPLDLLDEFLNTRYEQVVEATDWQGLEYHATIQTVAAYQSAADTVTFTVGSATVNGSGTAWTSAITGQKIFRPGDGPVYVATYVSGTQLTLDRPYEGNGVDAAGTVYAGSAYAFMQNIYALPSDASSVTSINNPVTGRPMQQMSKANLDVAAGNRSLVQNPEIFAAYSDSNESTPPVLRQIEFYPPPLYSRGYDVEYLHAPTPFDGVSTNLSPLPFVSSTVLLMGCRADIRAYLEDQAGARLYEAKFQEELARLLRVEHQRRRPRTALKMAPRFTRHRLARVGRGYRSSWGPGQGGPN